MAAEADSCRHSMVAQSEDQEALEQLEEAQGELEHLVVLASWLAVSAVVHQADTP